MPVNYGVLKGQVINAIPYEKGADHYQVEVQGGSDLYRIAIDVYSMLGGSKRHHPVSGQSDTFDMNREVMYFRDENFNHPITTAMLNLADGLTSKINMDPLLCLDFIRTNPVLFNLSLMKVVQPKDENGDGDDLNDDIDPWIQKAKNNPDATVFAFGSSWDDNAPGATPAPVDYFNPNPSLGIHDIHFNQGDSGSEEKANGTYQDGALYIHFASTDQWVAQFFKFQNQSIKTDNSGNPIP